MDRENQHKPEEMGGEGRGSGSKWIHSLLVSTNTRVHWMNKLPNICTPLFQQKKKDRISLNAGVVYSSFNHTLKLNVYLWVGKRKVIQTNSIHSFAHS